MITVVVLSRVVSDSWWRYGLQHARLPCPSPSPRVCSNSYPLSQWCHPTILFSVAPFSCLQSVPALRSFPMSWLFTSGGQSTGASASASILPMSIQGWFPLWFTSLISVLYKGLSRSSPVPQFESINSLVLSLPYGPSLTLVHDYWKNHSFDNKDLCWFVTVYDKLSRFIIAFLPRNRSLLISWLQSLSTVITMGHG